MVAHQSVFLINELLIPVRESAEKPSALSPRSLLIVNSNPRFQRSESLYFKRCFRRKWRARHRYRVRDRG